MLVLGAPVRFLPPVLPTPTCQFTERSVPLLRFFCKSAIVNGLQSNARGPVGGCDVFKLAENKHCFVE